MSIFCTLHHLSLSEFSLTAGVGQEMDLPKSKQEKTPRLSRSGVFPHINRP